MVAWLIEVTQSLDKPSREREGRKEGERRGMEGGYRWKVREGSKEMEGGRQGEGGKQGDGGREAR